MLVLRILSGFGSHASSLFWTDANYAHNPTNITFGKQGVLASFKLSNLHINTPKGFGQECFEYKQKSKIFTSLLLGYVLMHLLNK